MRDYSKWLRRAETFVRAVGNLSGEWSVKVAVEPPLSLDACNQLAQSLPHGLPTALRDFYSSASANARVHFSWEPHSTDLAIIEPVLPDQYTLYGGPEICSASELLGHHNHLVGLAEVLEDLGGYGPEAAAVMRKSVPVAEIGNGDYLAWHIDGGTDSRGVYYVSHEINEQEESPIIPVARSIEHFFDEWEQIGYAGPEIWILKAFLDDSPSRLLDANSSAAIKWRSVLKAIGLPVAE